MLKALLGKPDTLHSPGQILFTALGVPPALRGASSFWKLVEDHGRVGMLAASPLIPWVGCASVTGQGTVPRPKLMGDCFETRLPLQTSRMPTHVLNAAYCRDFVRGEVPAGSFGACTPPHRQPLCGVVGPFSLPVRNRILSCFNFEPKAKFLFCVCFNYFINFFFLSPNIFGRRTPRPPGAGNRPLRDCSRGHDTPLLFLLFFFVSYIVT